MKNDAGYLSIDFLAGFTIFLLAFIWVATLIPGLFINVRGTAIDFDAVAYRTGVILVEDPGWQIDGTSIWEGVPDSQVPEEVTRIGWAIDRDYPGILSAVKINRTFCATAFSYPSTYQSKVIFGDRPYSFNISVLTNGTFYQSLGPVRPDSGYGYIRRVAKVKEMSNATIDAFFNVSADNSTQHVFSPEMNITDLLDTEPNLAYQINPRTESTMINITNISSLYILNNKFHPVGDLKHVQQIRLIDVNITRLNPSEPLVAIPPFGHEVYVDGSSTTVIPTMSGSPPGVNVSNSVSIMFNSTYFGQPGMTTTASRVFVNYTFGLYNSSGTLVSGRCINSTFGNTVFKYYYGSRWLNEPRLDPAIVEVAVW